MKILYLGNNRVGLDVLRHLKSIGEDVVGLVIHEQPRQKFVREMLDVARLPEDAVFCGSTLGDPRTLERIRALGAEIGISVLFDYILKPECIEAFPSGVVNLHPAYLPYNRGQYPNVWSIVEGTPAGVTLHYIDAGIDTGDVIVQRRVPVEAHDTGKTLYRKLERACVRLFKETWPKLRAGRAERIPQNKAAGTCHRTRDVERIDEIDLDRLYTARELIDILRARTFPPYAGTYFRADGGKIHLRLQLTREAETEDGKAAGTPRQRRKKGNKKEKGA